jgi:hypothetical protein
MKKTYWILSLLFTFSGAFSQKQFPVIRNINKSRPPSANTDNDFVQPVYLSVQQPPFDSLVIYHFNSATDSLYESKRIYAYDSKSRKTDELWLSWDVESLSWKNLLKFHYAYDNADSLILDARYTYETGKWTGYFRQEKTYDVNGKLVLYIYSQEWDSTLNEFVPLEKEVTIYSGDNISEFNSYYWSKDIHGGEWVPQYLEVRTFNERGDCVLHTSSQWLQAENKWQYLLKDSTTYDDQGRKTLYYDYYWDWTSENWILAIPPTLTEYNGLLSISTQHTFEGHPLFKIEYVYDENGNILSDTTYNGDFTSNEWIYELKEIYTYDDNQNMTSTTRASWDETGNLWNGEARWETSFDDQNREILEIHYERYTDTADWKETGRFERTYDNSGNLVENAYIFILGTNASKVLNYFNNMGELESYVQYKGVFKNVWLSPEMEFKYWELDSKGYYYWNEQIQSGIPEIEAGSVLIYPNPAADVICISGIQGMANLSVYDLQGNLVLQRNAEPDRPISLTGLSKGMYLAKVKTADGVFERKIVKSDE